MSEVFHLGLTTKMLCGATIAIIQEILNELKK